MLRELRAVPVADARAVGVRPHPPIQWEELRRRAADAVVRLAAAGEVDVAPPGVAGWDEPSDGVLLHADLKGEHVLVDETGSVTGVLDWTDAAIGDPAIDVAGLAITVGAAAAVRSSAVTGYDAAVHERGVFLARCETLIRLDDRLRGLDDSPLPLLRRQFERAWEGAASRPA